MKIVWILVAVALVFGALAAWVADTTGSTSWTLYLTLVATVSGLIAGGIAVERTGGMSE